MLPGFNVLEGLGVDDPNKVKPQDSVFRARGRNLRGAIFDAASLPKVDFTGAELQGASLDGAQLQGASLHDANLQDASLVYSQLQGASLRAAQLQGASLNIAKLQGASLDDAKLRGAALEAAQLQGASLDRAQLHGASLNSAQLQGASLVNAQLQGAALDSAKLQGASLDGAQLQGASLGGAELQAASLNIARLQGAILDGAQLQGASLYGAQLQGASLRDTNLEWADLSRALLWRTNGGTPLKGDAANIAGLRLSRSPETWLPVWNDDQDNSHPWNDKAYQDLRQTLHQMMESVPPGFLPDQALYRIRSLDCANPDPTLASCDPSVPPPPEAVAWRKALEEARADDAAFAKGLAATLKTLLCSGGIDAVPILRNFLQNLPLVELRNSRLAATGTEASALVDFIMSKDCPVSASLTDADKASLLRIKQNAIKKPGG